MRSDNASQSHYGYVAANRTIRRLAEVCVPNEGIQTGPFGSQLHSADYVEVGTPMITVEHLGENSIEGKNPPLVSADDVKRLSKYKLKEGDIVFSRVGSVDRRALVSANQDGWMFSGRLLRVRPEPKLVDPTYLSYFFGLPKFKTYIRSIAVGATMPSLNTGLLSDIPVILPDMAEQVAIGRVLRSLDAKIRVNRALAKSLEDITQAIFRSWFIDFDPIKAKIAGEKPLGLDEKTAALFPDSMEESELGFIPRGWEAVPLTDMFEILSGGTPKTTNDDYWNGEIPWFSVIDAPNDGACFFIKTAKTITQAGLKNSAVNLVRPGVTVISARGTVGKIAIVATPSTFNQSCYGVEGKYGDFFTYLLLRNQISRLQSISHGGMFDTITRDTFSSVFVPKPTVKLMSSFDSLVEPLFFEIRNLQFQNQKLTELRDALLPRLISGELQIPEEMLAS